VAPLTREAVLNVLREAVEVFNTVHGEQQLAFAPETPLFGNGAPLSSLDLVMFLVEVESRLADRFGLEGSLSDDRAMSQQRSPFRSIGTLADYIVTLGSGANG
jgi:D-alanine--poly(phosphoribitol) ligase subunit 2